MTQIKNLPVAAGLSGTDFVVGDVNGVTKKIPLSVLAAEVAYTAEFVPIAFGAIGDGLTDDAVGLQAAINAALAYAQTAPGNIKHVTVDGQGKAYATSVGLTIAGNFAGLAEVTLVNCTLIPTASFPVNTYLLTCTGGYNAAENVTLNCRRIANGFHCSAYGSVYFKCRAYNFTQFGFLIDTLNDQCHIRCSSVQWFSSDPEYVQPTQWTGTCFSWRVQDCSAVNCNGHTGALVAEFTAQAGGDGHGGTTQLTSCIFYNGCKTASPGTFVNNALIRIDSTSGGIYFVGCYLGNGRIDLYTDVVGFDSCTAITKYTQDQLAYFIGYHSKANNTSPNYLVMKNWLTVSPGQFGPVGTPSTTPFFVVINDTGTTPGDFTNLGLGEASRVEAMENVIQTRLQIDNSLNQTYYSPNTSLSNPQNGAGLAFFSATTPSANIAGKDFFAIRETGGNGHLYRHAWFHGEINGTLTLDNSYSGRSLHFNNFSTPSVISLPHDAVKGWFCIFSNYQVPKATATCTIQTDSGFPASTWAQVGTAANSRVLLNEESITVLCIGNADGASATFVTVGERVNPNLAPIQITQNVSINSSNQVDSVSGQQYSGAVWEFTGAYTVTIATPGITFEAIAPASGNASIAASGVTLNGAGTTLTRSRASNPFTFRGICLGSDNTKYLVSGS